ncbi:hypothetical protein IC582_029357 [Cucumis melo]|uniref:Uncharacterized protein LOC103486495 n=1 Tax=Cucumis melo TaxID=3656 RepID=A0A1S3B5U3_CUCME|nr:uncharacterized protein LOC103486495 [Cucumis melo]
MADNDSGDGEVSSAQAVLLGALAPGVNGPTWTTLKSAFLMLGLCLVLMLALAFSSSDSWLILHVTFLVVITSTLFLLLNWFLSQTGLVSVKNQMEELQLAPKSRDKSEKNE